MELQCARGGVTRIGKEGLLLRLTLSIEALKLGPRQEHLATHLKPLRPALATQSEGNGADGAHIGRHVVATHAIAACHGRHEPPAFVNERDRCAVILQLGHHLEGLAERPSDAVVKLPHLVFGIRVAERKHRVSVLHLREALREVAAYALRGRIGVGPLRMCGLKQLQLAHHLVIRMIGDNGRGKHVVGMVMLIQRLPQPLDPVFYVVHLL